MSRSWLYIMGLLFLSGFLANMLGNAPWIVIGLDLAVLALSYRILQQDPFLNLRVNMIFLSIMLFLSALSQFAIIPSIVYYEGLAALLAWSWSGLHSRFFQVIVFGSAIYNAYLVYRLFTIADILHWPMIIVTAVAVLLLSYINQ